MDGITALDAAEATLCPLAFVATTVKVYDVPFVRPETVAVVPLAVAVTFPGVEVTV